MAQNRAKQGRSRVRRPRPSSAGDAASATATQRSAPWRPNYEVPFGGIIASCRRMSSITTVLKTLGMSKVEPSVHVNVGRDHSNRERSDSDADGGGEEEMNGEEPAQRTLGVSILGACSSKGCPTKSVENEDRYVHGKINLDLRTLQGKKKGNRTDGDHCRKERRHGGKKNDGAEEEAELAVPCWAFATFDGHAGPACAQYLREHFMAHLAKVVEAKIAAALGTNLSPPSFSQQEQQQQQQPQPQDHQQQQQQQQQQGNADAAAGMTREERTTSATVAGVAEIAEVAEEEETATAAAVVLEEDEENTASGVIKRNASVEVVLARLLTDTLASLTRTFEKEALLLGEISGACVISGLYCQGALVLGNIGDCQAVYHGQVKSAPGAPVTAQTTIHDASNPAEVNRFLMSGGYMSSSGRFQGVLEPSRTVGDVDVKAGAPKGSIASYPELFKVDIASEVSSRDGKYPVPPFLVLGTDGIWDETTANTVVSEVKDGIAKIRAHKLRYVVKEVHRRDLSLGSMTFTDGESDSEDEESSEFCGSGEWAAQGMDLAERVVSLARGRYDDATALVVVFE